MKRTGNIIAWLFFMHAAIAQEVQFTASAPSVVEVGEQFKLTYTLNQKASTFKAPAFDNFTFLGGPTQYSSSNMQFINGKMSQTFEISYTYFLQAVKEGNYTLAAAQASIGGKSYSSNPVKIEVVKGSKPAPSPSASGKSASSSQQAPEDYNNEDLFLRIMIDKKSVYFGEAVTAEVKIFSRVNLAQITNAVPPSFAGFFKNDMETPPLNSLRRENVNGQIYNTGVLQKYVLYPQKSGELLIEPFRLDCILQQIVKSRGDGFFDDFFGPTVQNIKRTIASNAIKINVKPLPVNKPSGFNGAVGDYTMKVSADKSNLKENDALTLKVEIAGTGNIRLIETPRINFPPDFETYDPKVTTNIAASGNTGNKVFEYLVIPRHAGNYRIPPVEFLYFNPSTGNYKNHSSDEFRISVAKADESKSAGVITGLSKEDIKFVGNDIRFIKTENIALKPLGKMLAGNIFFYLYFPVFLMLFAALAWLTRKQIRENADLALVRNRKANKIARHRLRTAEKYLTLNDKEAFYEELLRAVYGYMSDKLRIPLAELSLEKGLDELRLKETGEELIQKLSKLVDQCQYARYAPSGQTASMKEDYQEAASIIGKLEQNLR